MAAVNTKKVQELLEKMKHYDADERNMATSDLINELKNAQLEATLQAPVRQAILLQLEDKSPNVSAIAVKCLSTIVAQFAPEHLVAIVDKLGTLIADPERQEIRELIADASKTVIAAVTVDAGKTVMVTFTRSLITGLNRPPTKEGGLELSCLDVLKDVLAKFGGELTGEHASILTTLTKLLEHGNESVRKRTTVTIGPLVVSLTEESFASLMTAMIKKIETSRKPDIYIQTIGSVSQAAGVRVSPYLDKVIPAIEKFCQLDEKKKEESSEEDIELWEACLKSLDSIVRRCPNKVTPYVAAILNTATVFLSHDPNYSYDMDGGDDDMKTGDDDDFGGGGDGWGDDDGGDDDAWGDEDDTPKKPAAKAAAKKAAPAKAATKPKKAKAWNMPGEGVQDADTSWKVRAAAIRVISAFIRARSDILKTYYAQLSDTLVSRFKERDSAVKEEILLACRDLLHETVVSGRTPVADKEEALAVPEFIRTRSSYETLDLKVAAIVDACDKQFKGGDVRTQKAILTLLSELVLVRQGNLSLDKILPHVTSGIEGTGEFSAVNADALKLLHFVLEFHNFEQLKSFVAKFTAATVKAVKSGNQAIVPDGLRVLGSICKILAKQSGQEAIARDVYRAVFAQLVLNDVPQKMKLSAISAMATVLASFGGVLVAETKQAVPVLTDRLGNESTRQPALRAFTRIANSESKADLSLLAGNSAMIKEVSTFVRKALPVLRHETVTCLEALLRTHSASFKPADVAAIITEVASHINDEDLSMTHLVLDFISTSLTVTAAAAAAPVAKEVLPKTIALVRSPLLQGGALQSLIRFFATTVAANAKEAPLQYASLLTTLFGVVDGSLSKSSRLAVAQCIAGMTKRAGGDKLASTVTKCIGDVKSSSAAHVQIAALLTLGAIGQGNDLSDNKSVETVVTGAFESKDDETRAAAAYALGNVAVGNLARFLPSLLALIASKPAYQYLLFSALKESIAAQSKTREAMAVFSPYVDTISPILTKHAESKDEGVRDMVAQCLGLLTVIEPVKLLAVIEKFVRAPTADLRIVAMTALRFAFSPLTNWAKLTEKVDLFLSILRDADLGARRQAVLTLNALARANIETIPGESLKRNILPALYEEAKPHPELIREVDFGAFKEIVDDGLPLRKSAFQCLATLLDVAPHRVNMTEFITVTQQGLVDHPDIQIGTFQIFTTIAQSHGSSLLEILDQLPNLIMKSVKAHIAASKTKEPEQALDCLRATVRAMAAFNKIPGVEQATKYTFFVKQIAATPLLAQMQKEVDA